MSKSAEVIRIQKLIDDLRKENEDLKKQVTNSTTQQQLLISLTSKINTVLNNLGVVFTVNHTIEDKIDLAVAAKARKPLNEIRKKLFEIIFNFGIDQTISITIEEQLTLLLNHSNKKPENKDEQIERINENIIEILENIGAPYDSDGSFEKKMNTLLKYTCETHRFLKEQGILKPK
ncbi:16375_t:CDS:2 [Gigaspora rosea]|nr:16375_t:CDS:2 [Gigaspora rosea]